MTDRREHAAIKNVSEEDISSPVSCSLCCNEFGNTVMTNRNRLVTSSRFKCNHGKMFCRRCDARLQFDKSNCPMCRSGRKRLVRLKNDVCPVRPSMMKKWVKLMHLLTPDCQHKVVKLIYKQDAEVVNLESKILNREAMTLDVFESTSDLMGKFLKKFDFEKTDLHTFI